MNLLVLAALFLATTDSGITEDVVARTKKFEGSIAHAYLDSKGFVTVGAGHLLANAEAAVSLGFVKKAGGGAATDAEKQAEWETIHKQKAGFKASHYDQFAKLKLPDAAVNDLLKADLAVVEKELRAAFPDYDSYPEKAKAGLLDLGFNLGVEKLVLGFPCFVKAVKANDWKSAAKESHRASPITDERNAAVQSLLAESATSLSVDAVQKDKAGGHSTVKEQAAIPDSYPLDVFYYTYSTISQTLAGAYGFLAAVVLFRYQILREQQRELKETTAAWDEKHPMQNEQTELLRANFAVKDTKLKLIQDKLLSSLKWTTGVISSCFVFMPLTNKMTVTNTFTLIVAIIVLMTVVSVSIYVLWFKYLELIKYTISR